MLESKQLIKISGQELFYLTPQAALKKMFREIWTNIKPKANQVKVNQKDIPIEIKIDAFYNLEQDEAIYRRGKSRIKKLNIWLFIASLILFVFSVSVYGEKNIILIASGVIIFHELGHMLAMRLCGYQDTSIFMLPFFGGIALGNKDNATVWQKFIVVLAGPAPGIVLGAILLILGQMNQLHFAPSISISASRWLIGVNFFNLLPIFPLDGGQIAYLLMFSSHVYAEVFFKILAACLMLIMGLVTADPVLFISAIALKKDITTSFRDRKIIKKLQQQIPKTTELESLPTIIFQAIKDSDYRELQFNQKCKLVREVIQKYKQPSFSHFARTSMIIIYLICLISGFFLFVLSFGIKF